MAAENAAEPWVYEDIEELAAQGYLELPDKDLHSMSRAELSALVAKALARIEDSQGMTLADEYGRVTRLLVEDKVQLELSKEQLEAAGKIFRQRECEAKRASDDLARQSLRASTAWRSWVRCRKRPRPARFGCRPQHAILLWPVSARCAVSA